MALRRRPEPETNVHLHDRPPPCSCCAELATLVHALAAPACALQAAQQGASGRASAADAAAAQALLGDALARLQRVWQQGRVGLARAGHAAFPEAFGDNLHDPPDDPDADPHADPGDAYF